MILWNRYVLPLLWLIIAVLLQSHKFNVNAQSITVNNSCVKKGDKVSITFQNKNQRASDWIALIPANQNADSFTSFGDWVWTCGTQTCGRAVSSGTVRITTANINTGSWKAVLARDSDSPWDAYAVSKTFTVSTSCTSNPAPKPVPAPVPAPKPVSVPTPTGSSGGSNAEAQRQINDAAVKITSLIRNDKRLAPQFIRMVFHDCIGGCDGCIDLDNPDNAGIEEAIDVLAPIVNQHAIKGVSRSDIWVLSSLVATDVSQRRNSRIDFTMKWWGRVDCEKTGTTCRGQGGSAVACSAKKGPHHTFPNLHMNTHDLYGFFSDNFGFNQRETVTIMGAHTIGVIREEDFGIDAPNGWKLDNDVFDNGYYEELIGSDNPNDPIDVLVNDAPAWRRILINGVRHWEGRPQGTRIVMLNTDISLVRELDDSNFDDSIGRASCTFEDSTSRSDLPVCPGVQGALKIAAEFFGDNMKWLREYRTVFEKIITKGYQRPSCSDSICKLRKN